VVQQVTFFNPMRIGLEMTMLIHKAILFITSHTIGLVLSELQSNGMHILQAKAVTEAIW